MRKLRWLALLHAAVVASTLTAAPAAPVSPTAEPTYELKILFTGIIQLFPWAGGFRAIVPDFNNEYSLDNEKIPPHVAYIVFPKQSSNPSGPWTPVAAVRIASALDHVLLKNARLLGFDPDPLNSGKPPREPKDLFPLEDIVGDVSVDPSYKNPGARDAHLAAFMDFKTGTLSSCFGGSARWKLCARPNVKDKRICMDNTYCLPQGFVLSLTFAKPDIKLVAQHGGVLKLALPTTIVIGNTLKEDLQRLLNPKSANHEESKDPHFLLHYETLSPESCSSPHAGEGRQVHVLQEMPLDRGAHPQPSRP